MSCSSCSRRTLGLFIRSFTPLDLHLAPRTAISNPLQSSRSFSSSRGPRQVEDALTSFEYTRREYTQDSQSVRSFPERERKPTERERWQIEKAALKAKLGGEAWNPRKKLSPDAMEGIRHLHETSPDRFTTPILAEHFKVSPDAIRRILKSKWKPSDEEQEERLKRWDKRGEKIWSNLVELGVKPPKKWREMGVGRAAPGSRPTWKSDTRNTVTVQDSFSEDL
ncbi:Neugrin-domain-containing protein, partial [Lophiotrema nucula]